MAPRTTRETTPRTAKKAARQREQSTSKSAERHLKEPDRELRQRSRLLESLRESLMPRGAGKGSEMTPLELHDLATKGVAVGSVRTLLGSFEVIDEGDLLAVLGVSQRTLERRASSVQGTLDANSSDRALRLAAVTDRAIAVVGSRVAAERWLSSPALGLNGRKPLELLQTSEGTELVKVLLTRMDYGVYT